MIEAEEITHSIIGVRSVLQQGVVIRDSILSGNEAYERPTLSEKVDRPLIGENSVITRAILDENVTLGKGVKLLNRHGLQNYDPPEGTPEIYVRDGIIIVPRGTTLPDGFTF